MIVQGADPLSPSGSAHAVYKGQAQFLHCLLDHNIIMKNSKKDHKNTPRCTPRLSLFGKGNHISTGADGSRSFTPLYKQGSNFQDIRRPFNLHMTFEPEGVYYKNQSEFRLVHRTSVSLELEGKLLRLIFTNIFRLISWVDYDIFVLIAYTKINALKLHVQLSSGDSGLNSGLRRHLLVSVRLRFL